MTGTLSSSENLGDVKPKTLQEIDDYLQKYREFLQTYKFIPKIIKCVFINAYNHFLSGKILADNGMITQAHNCLRMGLESEWLGIILLKDPELGRDWSYGIGEDSLKQKLSNLEKPFMIRKSVGDNARIKIKDRDEIYRALSDKSHTKLSSVAKFFYLPESGQDNGNFDCIPMGGIQGENNLARIRLAVKTVITFALADLEECLEHPLLDKGWIWNRTELANISEGGFGNQQEKVEPFISSKGHPGQDPIQVIAFLSAIRHGEI